MTARSPTSTERQLWRPVARGTICVFVIFFHMFLHATSILILGMYMQFTISRNLQIYFIFPNSSQIKVSASRNLLFSEKNSELSLKCLMVVYRRSARKCHYHATYNHRLWVGVYLILRERRFAKMGKRRPVIISSSFDVLLQQLRATPVIAPTPGSLLFE